MGTGVRCWSANIWSMTHTASVPFESTVVSQAVGVERERREKREDVLEKNNGMYRGR